MESSARDEEALPKLFLRKELCGDLLDAELPLKTDLDWLLRLAEGMGLAEVRRPDGAVNVDSASESLVSVVNGCGTAILDWLTLCLPCHEAGVSDVPASMTAAFNLWHAHKLKASAYCQVCILLRCSACWNTNQLHLHSQIPA